MNFEQNEKIKTTSRNSKVISNSENIFQKKKLIGNIIYHILLLGYY